MAYNTLKNKQKNPRVHKETKFLKECEEQRLFLFFFLNRISF